MPYTEFGKTFYKAGEPGSTYKLPSGNIQDFDEIKIKYNADNLFEDLDFPAEDASIELDKLDFGPKLKAYGVHWRRPFEISKPPDKPMFSDELFSGAPAISRGITRFDIKQGALGNCWLLSSIGQMAGYPELVQLVLPKDNNTMFDDGNYCGAFHFRIFYKGEWVDIVVDDRLPCYTAKNGKVKLCFTGAIQNEYWVPLLEKVYAKLGGSYANIEAGVPVEALSDFSCGVYELINLTRDESLPQYQQRDNYEPQIIPNPDKIKDLLIEFKDSFKCIISWDAADGTPSEDYAKYTDEIGLVRGHAYALLDLINVVEREDGTEHTLVKIRNPWAHKEWNGDWSDKDPRWEKLTIDPRRKLEDGSGEIDDGEFYMTVEDFVKYYSYLYLVHWKDWEFKSLRGSFPFGFDFKECEDLRELQRLTPVLLNLDTKAHVCIYLLYLNFVKPGVNRIPGFGFDLFKLTGIEKDTNLDKEALLRQAKGENGTKVKRCRTQCLRDISDRFELEAGDYCILPFIEHNKKTENQPYLLKVAAREASAFKIQNVD